MFKFLYVHEPTFKAKIVSADSDWCSSGGATTRLICRSGTDKNCAPSTQGVWSSKSLGVPMVTFSFTGALGAEDAAVRPY